MIAVLLPIHDPRHWPNALEQYARQQHADKCLVVVANGFDDYLWGFEAATAVYQCPQKLGAARALNVAMNIARVKTPADKFAVFNCDDLYGEGYLTEVDWGLKRARVVGKSEYDYVDRTTDPPECVRVGAGTAGKSGYVALTGGTLAGYLAEALPFDDKLPLAEDAVWVIEMRLRVRDVAPLSTTPFNYVKQYWGEGHTHIVSFEQRREVAACL